MPRIRTIKQSKKARTCRATWPIHYRNGMTVTQGRIMCRLHQDHFGPHYTDVITPDGKTFTFPRGRGEVSA